MKIALFGYGKMGRAIESIISTKDEIVLKVNSKNRPNLTAADLKGIDVAIDFSNPESAIDNIHLCFDAHLPIVVGTTAWYDRFEEVKERAHQEKQSLFYATNFSIGVNIFFKLNQQLAQLMSDFPDYKIEMSETHHIQKKDAPSGTAITLAEGILNTHPAYNKWINESAIDSDIIPIISHREEDVKGTHQIRYISEIDEITIEHKAFSRLGFAQGALVAARWLDGKQGVYTMTDIMN